MNLVSIFLCSFLPGTLLIDPLTAGGILGASSVLFGTRNYIYCQFRECCQEPYIRSNLPGLKEALEENVFGQHIVTETVIKSMRMHLRKDQPKKALAMSFHGWTGSGKNYVSNFVAESLYKEGLNSKFVHNFISTLHFPGQDVEAYKSNLQNWIKENVTLCQRSLFIFDEIDKLPSGVIDAIIPFIDFHEVVDGVDYRKSIFIFLSNTGGKEITKFAYKHWENGMQRKDLSYSDLEESLNLGAFNELGGLQNADLIQKSLIDMYVPFLPLEKSHVKLCIRRELEKRKTEERKQMEDRSENDFVSLITFSDEDIDDMADKLSYWPKDVEIFSKNGCKKISGLVDWFLEMDWE